MLFGTSVSIGVTDNTIDTAVALMNNAPPAAVPKEAFLGKTHRDVR
jgi:hypothetical protein